MCWLSDAESHLLPNSKQKHVFGFNPHQLGFEIESNQTKTSNAT
jgi:hypothetical protein